MLEDARGMAPSATDLSCCSRRKMTPTPPKKENDLFVSAQARSRSSASVESRPMTQKGPPVMVASCAEINQWPGAPDNSSLSHFSAMTLPFWLGRAVRNEHHHVIEQASRRWRGG